MLFRYACSCEGRAHGQYRLGTCAGQDGLGLLLREALFDRLGGVDAALPLPTLMYTSPAAPAACASPAMPTGRSMRERRHETGQWSHNWARKGLRQTAKLCRYPKAAIAAAGGMRPPLQL